MKKQLHTHPEQLHPNRNGIFGNYLCHKKKFLFKMLQTPLYPDHRPQVSCQHFWLKEKTQPTIYNDGPRCFWTIISPSNVARPINGQHYLILVYAYRKWPEVFTVDCTTAGETIMKILVFRRLGSQRSQSSKINVIYDDVQSYIWVTLSNQLCPSCLPENESNDSHSTQCFIGHDATLKV